MELKFKNKLIIGIGNPLKKYEKTYHNIGKLAINYIIQKFNLTKELKQNKYFEYCKLNTNDNLIYLINSKTFMNESGLAVQEVIKQFKINPENILVIHDDSDLIIGKFKYVFNRGSAGHHGIESIFQTLKTKKFWRMRIGIRPKNFSQNELKAEQFVLKNIKPQDKKIFYSIFDGLIEKLIEKTLPFS